MRKMSTRTQDSNSWITKAPLLFKLALTIFVLILGANYSFAQVQEVESEHMLTNQQEFSDLVAPSLYSLRGRAGVAAPKTNVSNPDLPSDIACDQLDIIFILDESYSISQASASNTVRSGALALANALNGSGATLRIIEFDTRADLINLPSTVVNSSFITQFNNYLYGLSGGPSQSYNPTFSGGGCSSGYTNWEDALILAQSYSADLIIFFTDGSPTAYNTNSGNCGDVQVGTFGSTPSTALARAITQANAIKNSGVHMFAIGVGSVNSSNLQDISGSDNFADNGSVYTDDYSIGSFSDLASNLTSAVNAICGTELTIEKTVTPSPVCPNTQVTFTITVTNSGGDFDFDANNTVLTDAFPAGFSNLSIVGAPISGASFSGNTLTYNIGTLAAGNSVSISVNADSPGSNGNYDNTAFASADNADQVSDNALLVVSPNTGQAYDVDACIQYFWAANATVYTSSGQYVHATTNEFGCSNSDTLNLTINLPNVGIDTQEACDSYTWIDGNTYTASNNSAQWTLTNQFGCDSIVTLDLTILESTSGIHSEESCEPYTWIDGNTYPTSNNTAQWTLTNAAGCDSLVTLDLTILESTSGTDVQEACDSYTWIDGNTYTASNNTAQWTLENAAGCDSIVTLDLTILESTESELTITECDTYTLNDVVYDASGVYTQSLENAAGCDSTITLNLTILESTEAEFFETACDSYTLNDETYTESGFFTQSLTNAAGCDSTIILFLTILESTTGTDVQEACDSYTWIDGNTYTASNNSAQWTLENAAGCDSIVTLDLTILESTSGTDVQEACDSYTWIDGNTYTASNNSAQWTLENAAGCDSIVTLDLTILESTSGTDVQEACDSYTWIDGVTYTASNNSAQWTLENAAGCDSIVTLDLTILESTFGTDVQEACDSYTWIDGVTYTTSNNSAQWTLENAAGCDSIVTLDLTILESTSGTDVQEACDSYTWIDGITYTSSNNSAQWTLENAAGCDSIVTLDLTILESTSGTDVQEACDSYTWIDGNTYTSSNNSAQWTLENAAGCDSIVTLDLTILESTSGTDVQEACDSYTWIDGNTYTASNNSAQWTLENAAGCDSIVTLDLTILESTSGTDVQEACDSYTWIDGNTYTASNNSAQWTLENAAGCDSIVTLDLTILESTSGTDVQEACDSYTWIDGVTYTASNNSAQWTLENAAGCDSIVTLDLTILESTSGTDVQEACDSYTWIDGNTYTSSNNSAQWTLENAAGCDSIVTLDLTILESTSGTDVQEACDSYTWIDGNTYTSSNNSAQWTLENAAGCDSIVTLDLTILESTFGTDVQEACDSYTWIDGNTYTASNNSAQWTLENAAGCDSIVTLDLTILESTSGTDVQEACDSYTWIDGNTYTASNNSAQWTLENAAGCDSIVTLDLTILESTSGTDVQEACDSYTWIDGVTYTTSNNSAQWTLENAAGCDSIVTLDLTILESTSGTDVQEVCDSYTWIDGNTYTASNNTAQWTLENAAGCDSIVTLDLTILESTESELNITECDTYTLNGIEYDESGVYTQSLENAAGCDSTITLNLTILESSEQDLVETACDSYTLNDETYTESGEYQQTLESQNGCILTINLDLTILESTESELNITECDTYTLNDVVYDASGVYTQSLENAAGCDSTITLNLTILESTESEFIETACDSYTLNDETYTESGVFTQSLTNAAGCDSTITLFLTILESTSGTDVQEACDSYTWIDGNTYTASNNSAQWTLENSAGCDSIVTLDLTILESTSGTDVQEACDSYTWVDGNTYTASNNSAQWTLENAAGCDSIVTLDLTILESTSGTDVQEACDSYTWIDGNTYTASNNSAQWTLENAAGCDSIVTLDLTILESTESELNITECDTYTLNDVVYDASGVYTQELLNTAGCDSTITLNLTILESTESEFIETACDSYTLNDETYTESGVFTQSLTNAAGCDSTITLFLTILESTSGTDVQEACDSYTWIDGNTYTASNNSAQWTLENAAGCDSLVTLDLTILESTESELNITECDTYTLNGVEYDESGVYTQSLENAAGCDSTITLNLTILESSEQDLVETACDSYTLNDVTYTESGEYQQTLESQNGCILTINLDLTILESTESELTITECDTYTLNDVVYDASGVYTQELLNAAGCDSTITLNLTILESSESEFIETACDSYTLNDETYTESGVFTQSLTNAAGCDSTITLFLTILESTSGTDVQEACDSYTWIDGNTYTASNNSAQWTLENSAGCDSIVTLDLTILESTSGTDVQEACDSYTWIDGNTYTASNNSAQWTLENAAGCDSIVTLDLTILESTESELNITECDTYTLNGVEYDESGVYTQSLENAAGCDSTITLNLTILESSEQDLVEIACDSYTLNDETYTESGEYQQTLESQNGCILTINLDLTILESTESELNITECDTYTLNDVVYDASGVYTQSLENAAGCDSTITLNLTILESTESEFIETACDSYTLNDETYTESGVFTQSLTNAAGCDSTITLFLTILESTSGTDVQEACDSFTWIDGNTYTANNNTAQWTLENAAGCDSIVTLDLTILESSNSFESVSACVSYEWNGQVYNQSGIYTFETTNAAGCDSIATLDLTLNGPDCFSDEDCENFQAFYVNHGSGVEGSDLYAVEFVGGDAVFTYETSVEFEAHIAYNEVDEIVYLVNANGSFIRAYDPSSNQFLGDLNLASGINELYAVVYDPQLELIYVGDAGDDEIYSINPNGDGSYSYYAEGPIQGGDLAIQNGEMYLATRQGNKLYQIVEGGSPILVGDIPAEVNGMAAAKNGTDLITTNFGSDILTQVSSGDASTTTSFQAILDGEPFTLNNGDFTSGCTDGNDDDVCEDFKLFYLANGTAGVDNGTVFELEINGGEAKLIERFNAGMAGHLAVNGENGDFYVIAASGLEIKTFDAAGTLIQTSPIDGLNSTYAMAWDPADNKVYVGSANADKVYKLDPTTGFYTVFAENVPVNGGDLVVRGDQVILIQRSGSGSIMYDITSGDEVFISNIATNVNGASETAAGDIIVAHGGGTSEFIIYDENGAELETLLAVDEFDQLFTLQNGDMAGACYSSNPVEECEYTLFYSDDSNDGSGTDIYSMTINEDNTTSNTLLTTVDYASHGIAYDNNGLLYILNTPAGSYIVWDVTTNSLAGGPINIETAGGTNVIKTPTAVFRDGVLYVGSAQTNEVYAVNPATGVASNLLPAIVSGGDLLFDGNDDLWIVNRGQKRFTNLTGGGTFQIPALSNMLGAALLDNGNFAVANGDLGSNIYEVDPVAQGITGVVYDTGLAQYWGDLTAGCVQGESGGETPGGCYASEIFEYAPGTKYNGGVIDAIRTIGENALGEPEGTDEFVFASLGYGDGETDGFIILGFDGIVINGLGDDIQVIETSFNNPGCDAYPEYVDVYVSENGVDYYNAGTVCKSENTVDISDAEPEAGHPLTAVTHVKLVTRVDLSTSPDGFDVDGVIALHNCEGQAQPQAIAMEDNNELGNAQSLLSSFPNPVADQSTVSFTVYENQRSTLAVYDMNGRLVETLFSQEAQANEEYRFSFNASNLPNGVYIYRLTTQNETVIDKFMIAR